MMYVDADILFAFLKPSDRHLEFARGISGSGKGLYTSAMAFVELELVAKRELNEFLASRIISAVLEKVPALKIIAFDRKILEASLELQRRFGLGIFDSIHAATALSKDRRIASTDHIFDRVPALERIGPEVRGP